ncbi:MAG: hypothetical protein PHC80_08705, partial [Eubacteriales bacterium]|nr:hypothetical protein [Eubacteriales bacterium]
IPHSGRSPSLCHKPSALRALAGEARENKRLKHTKAKSMARCVTYFPGFGAQGRLSSARTPSSNSLCLKSSGSLHPAQRALAFALSQAKCASRFGWQGMGK